MDHTHWSIKLWIWHAYRIYYEFIKLATDLKCNDFNFFYETIIKIWILIFLANLYSEWYVPDDSSMSAHDVPYSRFNYITLIWILMRKRIQVCEDVPLYFLVAFSVLLICNAFRCTLPINNVIYVDFEMWIFALLLIPYC